MAELEQQERTESPSQKRLEDARKRGHVPRSPELAAAAVLLATSGAIALFGGGLASRLHGVMQRGLTVSRAQLGDEAAALMQLRSTMLEGLLACAPLLGAALCAALLAPLALGGWNFSTESLAPRLERIDPAAGIARMFSLRSLVELAKSLAKFGLVGAVAVAVLWTQSADILAIADEPVPVAMAHALRYCSQALLAMAAALGLIAAVDVPYQLWQHDRSLRMTREEVRQEHKENEGSPEIKGRIRSAQQALARRRMMQAVPKADVVITNPTHYAVALRYDESRMRAPTLVAKGADEVAARIREVAAEHGVPLVSAPPLARVLFRHVDIGVEIPASLYVAVAQVLTYVLQLKAARRDGREMPAPPQIDAAVESVGRGAEG